MKKLTYEFVKEQFEKEGYKLLSTEYINSRTKLDILCNNNHIYSVKYNDFQQGKRCAECSGVKKLTIGFIKEQFEKEGYTLLSTEYINNSSSIKYICPKGHKGDISYKSFKRGHRCAKCGGTKKLTYKEIKNKFEKEGYILISKEYINVQIKLDYICPEGHKGSIKYDYFQQGKRCAECSKCKRYTIEDIKKRTIEIVKDYECISDKYINNRLKLKFKCNKNHIFLMSWSDFQMGHRCQKCSILHRSGENHYKWDHNITEKEREINRNYPEYREWRSEVYKRDDYTCQKCGDRTGGNLNAHHIESYRDNPEFRTKLSNGIAFCKECHMNFHHIFGYGNNTKVQLQEFLNEY